MTTAGRARERMATYRAHGGASATSAPQYRLDIGVASAYSAAASAVPHAPPTPMAVLATLADPSSSPSECDLAIRFVDAMDRKSRGSGAPSLMLWKLRV